MATLRIHLKEGLPFECPESNIDNIQRVFKGQIKQIERIGSAPEILAQPAAKVETATAPTVETAAQKREKFGNKSLAQLKGYADFLELPKEEWIKLSKVNLVEYLVLNT